MKFTIITQARFGSSRLPGKVLKKIDNLTLLEIHLKRLKNVNFEASIVVATTIENESDIIISIAQNENCLFLKGSINDVLERFYQVSLITKSDYIVRVTSDCPLIDPKLINMVVKYTIDNKLNYCMTSEEFPDGVDIEVFKSKELEFAYFNAILNSDREHVTPYIRRICKLNGTYGEFKCLEGNFSDVRMTVDEQSDLDTIHVLVEKLGINESWPVYANYIISNPGLFTNQQIIRNSGYIKSLKNDTKRQITNFANSDKYRNKIHQLIPGGAHTYSKGDDQFPLLSPAAISHGKGVYVWDIDDNMYLDCSMGLTSVSLGHAYEPVLNAVKVELEKGVNFQRPSVLEKETAEKFLTLVPQHDMIKFAKNGSIVTTAAVKLARAFTSRKLVAIPGDHPFYSYDDWFIGTTDCNKGIPNEFSDLTVKFKSCDINSLKQLFQRYPGQIACVITEPEKSACGNTCNCSQSPAVFLKEAIELTHNEGALFIIDEMVSGFKSSFPGSMTKYDLKPDMATWGKGIANGFSFCALTGTKEIMELGGINNIGEEKVFLISTTHGGETHAMAAANATIDVFQQQNVVNHNHQIGDALIKGCQEAIIATGSSNLVDIIPCNWLVAFSFKDSQGQLSAAMRTLAMQEMIKRGILFQGAFSPCFSHSLDDVAYFVEAFSQTLEILQEAEKVGLENILVGDPAKPVFRKFL